jgi:hypothetical protein
LRVGKNTTVAIAWCRGGPHHHLSEVSNTTKVKIVHFFPFPHTKKEKEDDQDEGRSSSPTHIKGRRLFFSSLSKKSVIDVVFIRHGSSRLLCNIMSALSMFTLVFSLSSSRQQIYSGQSAVHSPTARPNHRHLVRYTSRFKLGVIV